MAASVLLQEAMRDGLSKGLSRRFKKRRGRLEIIKAVLSTALEGVCKTEIVYGANLNAGRAGKYISLLEEKGLIESHDRIYKTTEKGEEFLHVYQRIRELIPDLHEVPV